MTDQSAPIKCRLCGGEATYVSTRTIMKRHQVAYYCCMACDSVETELPHWLDDAYAIPGVHIDVGVASRTVKNWMALTTLFGEIGLEKTAQVIDFGGGTGLLARLLRDVGYNASAFDKYAAPFFTNYFNLNDFEQCRPTVVTAFEVLEHFVEPGEELRRLLASNPDLVVFTTWFRDGQPDDWIYYVESCGQHVFFYSETGLRKFVDRLGYDLVLTSFFHILLRRGTNGSRKSGVETFRLDCAELVYSRSPKIFKSIAFGNEDIDADFQKANSILDLQLMGSYPSPYVA